MDDQSSTPPEESPSGVLPRQLRRQLARKSTESEAEGEGDPLASVIIYLSTLHAQLKKGQQEGGTVKPKAEGKASALREKRMPRTGAGLEQGFAELGQRASANLFEPARNGLPATASPEERSSSGGHGAPRAVWIGLASALLLAAVVASIIWWPHAAAPTPPGKGTTQRKPGVRINEPLAERKATDAGMAAADQILEAMQHGKLAEASALIADAQKHDLVVPGMNYQAALLAYGQGKDDEAEDWIDQAVAMNEDVPECLFLQANTEAAKGNYDQADQFLEEATRAAPFSPRYFFLWGESLRRKGNPARAIPQFKQAWLRRPTREDSDLILFKMHLAMIEAGDQEAFQKELAEQLTRADVSGDTLLVAAANEINRGAFPAGAAYLRRAAQALPPAMRFSRLRDYFFKAQEKQPDIAAALAEITPKDAGSPPPARWAKTFVDPATRGLAEVDPGTW